MSEKGRERRRAFLSRSRAKSRKRKKDLRHSNVVRIAFILAGLELLFVYIYVLAQKNEREEGKRKKRTEREALKS